MRVVDTRSEILRLIASPRVHQIEKLAEAIAENRVLLEGHFELQSGRHSRYFVRFAGLGGRREQLDPFVPELISTIPRQAPCVVVAPESAAVFLGIAVADQMDVPLAVAAIDAKRRPTSTLRHGSIPQGHQVVVVTDVLTTSLSLEPLLDSLGERLLAVVSFGALSTEPILRIEARYGVQANWLVTGTWSSFDRGSCSICSAKGEELLPAGEFN